MGKYKLTITFDLGDDEAVAKIWSREILQSQDLHSIPGGLPMVGLTREGDRSGANLLAPVSGTNHFKNHKVLINDALAIFEEDE